MNWDQIEGNWSIVKGRLQQTYAKLTNDELEKARGNREELLGLLQARYGKARAALEQELDDLIRSL
ncbi:CsbD family protein [Leisingera thetidis]|uniref:CsbD family protein n=1 Tax=Leisingera thetidis TaxID=2930199 RepID=UPI0021F7BF0C|nr:CsbD family protein [Leisingera thetidis]